MARASRATSLIAALTVGACHENSRVMGSSRGVSGGSAVEELYRVVRSAATARRGERSGLDRFGDATGRCELARRARHSIELQRRVGQPGLQMLNRSDF
jgi:hypothetical protein